MHCKMALPTAKHIQLAGGPHVAALSSRSHFHFYIYTDLLQGCIFKFATRRYMFFKIGAGNLPPRFPSMSWPSTPTKSSR